MSPLFKYFGSKWTSSFYYSAPVGEVCEPFAGSACYSLRWGVERAVLLDTDDRVCALWEYLIHVSPDEIRALPLLSVGDRVSALGLPYEQRLLLSCWVNTSPWRDTMGGANRSLSLWGEAARERVANNVQRIRGWRVLHADYTAAPESATTFVDPPYQRMGRHYREGCKKLDYAALGAWCRSRNGLVIACEQEGADWLPWNGTVPSRRTARKDDHGQQRGGDSVMYREVCWTSSEVTEPFLSLAATKAKAR